LDCEEFWKEKLARKPDFERRRKSLRNAIAGAMPVWWVDFVTASKMVS
jgi:hypothetical protein